MRGNIEEGTRIMGAILVGQNKLTIDRRVLTADNLVLDADSPHLISLDPGGAGRDILLPPEAPGLFFFIMNWADAAETLTVKDDSDTTTIGAVAQGKMGIFVCDGTNWAGVVQGT